MDIGKKICKDNMNLVTKSGITISFPWKVGKMCGRTCVGVTSGKKARTQMFWGHFAHTHIIATAHRTCACECAHAPSQPIP